MDIKLNFINSSNDLNNSHVVVFQKNVAANFGELAVAWTVIEECGQGDNHPFDYPMAMQISASDSHGNFAPQLVSHPGQAFQVTLNQSGHALSAVGAATSPTAVQVNNNLKQGAISACIYRNGKLLAHKTGVAPQQTANFEFKPSIWIGAVPQVAEGEVMNSAVMSQVNTEISLLGISSADIVMTGGGPGETSTPFMFSLQNVVMA